MNKRIFSAVATAFILLPLGVNAAQANLINNDVPEQPTNIQLAQNQMPQNKRMGRGNRMEKLLQQLDLTSEQSQQIETIQEQFRSENEALWQEMQANKQQMRSLLSSDTSAEELRQQHQQAQSLHQQLSDNRFETMLQIRDVLTPEQRSELAQIMEQNQGRRGERNFDN
jgi:Spy/CpxP family protein refolding chaperone